MHAALKEMLGDDIYVSWFPTMEVGDFDGHTLRTFVPVKFFKTWIDHHYSDPLLQAAHVEFFGVERVKVLLRKPIADQSSWEPAVIKWFNRRRGFGFAQLEDGQDVFVHARSLANRFPDIRPGQQVVLRWGFGRHGMTAVEVRRSTALLT